MNGKKLERNSRYKLLIHSSVLGFLESEAAKATRTETGGVLAGRGDLEQGEVHLTHASKPGPNAKKTLFSFTRDTIYCQQFLDRVAIESKSQIDYLGEWHKHHEADPRPSFRDIITSREIALSPDYHVRLCLLLIIGRSNHRRSLRAFVISPSGDTARIEWSVCAGCESVSSSNILVS